jgi:hypothetical protein
MPLRSKAEIEAALDAVVDWLVEVQLRRESQERVSVPNTREEKEVEHIDTK